MHTKILIRDTKTLDASIRILKKKIADVDFDLTRQGVKSIANALLAIKKKVDSAQGFAEMRDLIKGALKDFDTPKSREIKNKLLELDRLFARDPRQGGRNDKWLFDRLLQYYYQIILKASGNPSPDAKPSKKEEITPQDSCQAKDDQDDVAKIIRLLGEAHSLIIEASELASDLWMDGKVNSQLGDDIDELEKTASDLDFLDTGADKFLEHYRGEKTVDEDEDEGLPMDEDEKPRLVTDPLEAGQWYE